MNIKKIAKEWRMLLGLLSVLSLFGCESYPDGTLTWLRSDINEAKNLYYIPVSVGMSIGEAFDSWFDSPSWTSHPSYFKKGETKVTFKGKTRDSGQQFDIYFDCGFNSERKFRVCENGCDCGLE
jgi:hypothetical protein